MHHGATSITKRAASCFFTLNLRGPMTTSDSDILGISADQCGSLWPKLPLFFYTHLSSFSFPLLHFTNGLKMAGLFLISIKAVAVSLHYRLCGESGSLNNNLGTYTNVKTHTIYIYCTCSISFVNWPEMRQSMYNTCAAAASTNTEQ